MSGFIGKIREFSQTHHVVLRKTAGVLLGLFTMLAFIGCVSYLFTWKQDQSLLLDPALLLDKDCVVANLGGKLGLKLSGLLVADCFGLGALAVVLAFGIISVRLFFGERKFSVLKSVLLALTGAMLLSFVLAYISDIVGATMVFGGGLGGEYGAQAILWIEGMVGKTVAFFFLLALCAAWAYFSSDKFSAWFLKIGDKAEKKEPRPVRTFNFMEKKKTETDVRNQEPAPAGTPAAEPVNETVNEPAPVGKPVNEVAAPVNEPEPVNTVAQSGGPDDIDMEVEDGGGELSTDVVKDLPRIDVRDELPKYQFPTLNILHDYADRVHNVSSEELKRNNFKIRATLQTYKIGVEDVKAVVGPTVTLYKVYPSQGVRIQSIINLDKEIAMTLGTNRIRMVTLVDSIGIEVPNDTPSVVPLKALLNSDAFRNSKAELPVAIGYTITREVKVFDLTDAPHLLVAGATKQGKSVGLNVLIASLLYAKHPSELKFVFVDPKSVEFTAYSHLLHHYLAVLPDSGDAEEERNNAIVTKAPAAEKVLKSLCVEMDDRYELLNKAGVNNVVLYNNKYRDRKLLPTAGHRYLPYLVTIIDEYADLTMSAGATGDAKNMARSITTSIIRLAQKGRAAGIHVVIATQRPSVDIITGVIRANFPTRIAFRVISNTDSKIILDSVGAEKLVGKGDMLYYAGVSTERVQCAFIDNDEVNAIARFIGDEQGYQKSYNTPYYLPEPEEKAEGSAGSLNVNEMDEYFEEAARLVVSSQKGSTSDIQRRIGMGYARAGRVMDQLEAAGIVGPQEGSKPRQVLIGDLDELDLRLKELRV